jgi:hypothetical protein
MGEEEKLNDEETKRLEGLRDKTGLIGKNKQSTSTLLSLTRNRKK